MPRISIQGGEVGAFLFVEKKEVLKRMNKKIAAIVSILSIVVVIASSGCFGGGCRLKDMAKMVPEGESGISYFDLQTTRDDKDLYDLYKLWEEELNKGFEDIGVDWDDINYMATTDEGLYSFTGILGGRFDLKDVREELEYQDFDVDAYKGVEFWTVDNTAVAINGHELIIGDVEFVKNCINVMRGSRASLYEDKDIKAVIDKLSDGIAAAVTTKTPSSYRNALVMGYVIAKEDENTLKAKGIIKFGSDDEAEDAKSIIKREKREGVFSVTVKQHGQFVLFSYKMNIEDILQPRGI